MLERFRGPPPPSPNIARLGEPAKLLVDPDADSEVAGELAKGELVETFADLEEDTEWVLVRAPLEDDIDTMSDKPLEYQDGWLHNPSLELAQHQVGDKVAARVELEHHPVLQLMRLIPPWRGAELPKLMTEAVSEFHNGKIGGVIRQGRFLVQRPAGAIPERVAANDSIIFVPKQRKKRTVVSAMVGMVVACCLSALLHGYKWAVQGRSTDQGRHAWPTLISYWTFVVVFTTPLFTVPCYTFAISHLSTASAVGFLNMLLYNDLFSE